MIRIPGGTALQSCAWRRKPKARRTQVDLCHQRTQVGDLCHRGFTIIEVIVIVVILGVLAAIIAPRLIGRIGQSKQAVAEANAASLASSVKLFMADHGKPDSGATIDILWSRPADVDEAGWEPYVDSADDLIDPWGNKFVLVIPGQENYDFDVVSYGADGSPGGEGEDADIIKP